MLIPCTWNKQYPSPFHYRKLERVPQYSWSRYWFLFVISKTSDSFHWIECSVTPIFDCNALSYEWKYDKKCSAPTLASKSFLSWPWPYEANEISKSKQLSFNINCLCQGPQVIEQDANVSLQNYLTATHLLLILNATLCTSKNIRASISHGGIGSIYV